MNEELEILIKACQKNNRRAQGDIYKMFSPKMYAICLRYCNSKDDANDCLQETFIHAFEKIKQYKSKGSFEGWLRKLTTNICLNKIRKRTFFVVADENTPELIDDSTEKELDIDRYDLIIELMKEMPSSYKTIFNLFIIEEYSHKEIADKLNISEGTSKSNLSRAKNWIRNEIKKNTKLYNII